MIHDPIHGSIQFSSALAFDIVQHPYFQRLRYIQQSGLAYLVFPGAIHNRFAHSIGAMHLMQRALEVLRQKDIAISAEDAEAAVVAMLLHDIGHGPFSHALEYSIIQGLSHEAISKQTITLLNNHYQGALDKAMALFDCTHPATFLCEMIASQLDMDRLDYLQRDSFYSGVAEATIGLDRIIAALNVHEKRLCVDIKAVYSLEQFLLARKIMYLQVYLHKTVIGAEVLLKQILRRAQYLARHGEGLFTTPLLEHFLYKNIHSNNFTKEDIILFLGLDESAILACIGVWCKHDDFVLNYLCNAFVQRRLFRITTIEAENFEALREEKIRQIKKILPVKEDEMDYFVQRKIEKFTPYNTQKGILIREKNGQINDLHQIHTRLGLVCHTAPVKKDLCISAV